MIQDDIRVNDDLFQRFLPAPRTRLKKRLFPENADSVARNLTTFSRGSS